MDLSICQCEKKMETTPSEHDERCPYRLRYDEVELMVPITEAEALAACHLIGVAKKALESYGHPISDGAKSLEQKMRGAYEAVAQIRLGNLEAEIKKEG